MATVRKASSDDFVFLCQLEKESFSIERRSSRKSLRQSLVSNHQEVYVLEDIVPIGSAIVHYFKHTARLYSIAISKNTRGQGSGFALLRHCENTARSYGISTFSLEADANAPALIEWYQRAGFEIKTKLEDYYGPNMPAYRMVKIINDKPEGTGRLKNVVIVESPLNFLLELPSVEVITPVDYLSQVRFQQNNAFRIFNFSTSYHYQSKGYYMSLLASARDHRVIPTVATLQDFSNFPLMQSLSKEVRDLLNESLHDRAESSMQYPVFFGYELNGQATKLSKNLFKLFEAPLMVFTFLKHDKWMIQDVKIGSINDLATFDENTLREIAVSFFSQKKFNRPKLKSHEYDLAILINPEEPNPPSDLKALKKFKKAGERNGFFVEFITKEDMHRINEFDALLIRETTAVNNHTYQFARYAYAEGLIVIDDPWSILKCSNKFYLQERMKKAKIKMPKSCVLGIENQDLNEVAKALRFPMVLKQPDSAFSLGVHRVENLDELSEKSRELLLHSEFIIAQEFMPSSYDWRIGILDNRAIFACRYYMAEGHWQIYDWNSETEDHSGLSDTVSISEVPEIVLSTALRAASFIGDGLYGVDLKLFNNECFLIEINDNPNIDHDVEDLVSGDALYETVIQTIRNRIRAARNIIS